MLSARKIAILEFGNFNDEVFSNIIRTAKEVINRPVLVRKASDLSKTRLTLYRDYLLIVCISEISEKVCNELQTLCAQNRCLIIYDSNVKFDFQQIIQTNIHGLMNANAIAELPKALSNLKDEENFLCQLTLRKLIGETISINKSSLTRRELEILTLMTKGLKYQEIGLYLGISYDTTKTHIQNIYKKLGARNKVEAVHKARTRMALFQNVSHGENKTIISD